MVVFVNNPRCPRMIFSSTELTFGRLESSQSSQAVDYASNISAGLQSLIFLADPCSWHS